MVTAKHKLYPCHIHFCKETGGYEDEIGDWHPGKECWSRPFRCDAVPSSDRPNVTTFEDGEVKEYSWLIVMPKSNICPKLGQRVKLYRQGQTKEYTIKGIMRYMFRIHIAL